MREDLRGWVLRKQQTWLPEGSLHARFTLGALWAVAGAVISRGLTLCASIACARFLGKTQFGELGMIQSTVGMFGSFAGLGLGLTATKYVAEFRDRDARKVGRILALSALAALFSGSVMTILLLLLAPTLSANTLNAPQLVTPLAVGSGLVFFGALNGAQTGALAGFEAFRAIAVVNIWAGVSSFPLVLLGVWRWGLPGAVGGLVASLAVNWVLNNGALRRESRRSGIPYHFASCSREWKVLYKFSLPAFLASIVVGPALWICGTLLVHQPDGYAQLGLYTAADRWRLLILFVPTSVFGMVVPVLSNLYGVGDQFGYRKVFRANLLVNAGLALLPAVAIMMFAQPIMSLYGGTFRSGWPILILLSCSAIPDALNNIFMARLISADRMWWRFGLDLQLVGMLLLLGWWWIPRQGAMGLGMAYLAAISTICLSHTLLAPHLLVHRGDPELGSDGSRERLGTPYPQLEETNDPYTATERTR
jgi:O-antigen/teichoic acid export membrane protein